LQHQEDKVILKKFRKETFRFFIKEILVVTYLRNAKIMPKILDLSLSKKILILEYMIGERLLEWALRKCSRESVNIKDYKNMHGIDTNSVVLATFHVFQQSKDPEIVYLKNKITMSYKVLHRYRISQGDVRPRNLIYRQNSIAIIDFDHALFLPRPAKRDNVLLKEWYGIRA